MIRPGMAKSRTGTVTSIKHHFIRHTDELVMAHDAFRQFVLDLPRIDFWIDCSHQECRTPGEAKTVFDSLFDLLTPREAWIAADMVSQGSLATYWHSAYDTFARGANQHIKGTGRQHVELITTTKKVYIEKSFCVFSVINGDAVYDVPKRLYLLMDLKKQQRVKSAWQHDDCGIWIRPFIGDSTL